MKVALVVPNFRWIDSDKNTLWHYLPYNLCLLAAIIKDEHEVSIIDAYQENLSEKEFAERIRALSPEVVGITVLMDEYGQAGHICARLVKQVNPNIITVLGGVYATVNANQAIQDTNINYVIIGEGEYVFKDLLSYHSGSGVLPDKGICFLDCQGNIINKGHSDFIKDLDSLPLPAYDLIDFNKYANNASRHSVDSPRAYPYARIITSRGCPFNCIFCQVSQITGKRFRGRSADNVLDEIKVLKSRYGIKSIIFDDDNMLFVRDSALDIFNGMIKNKLVMPWVMIATAVFELDPELLRAMKDSGCQYIDVAFETGTDRILKDIIDKPVNFEYAKEMVKLAKWHGIFVAANFIVGFPTETWQEIRNTLRYAEEINADYIKIFAATPLKNTRLWDICARDGLFKKGFDPNNVKWSTGQIETDEFSSDALTILRAYEWDRINFTSLKKTERICKMMGITLEEMDKKRKQTLTNVKGLLSKESNGIQDKIWQGV